MDLGLLRDVLRSEYTKLRSVRSTYWSTLIAIILGIGLSAAIAAAVGSGFKNMSVSDQRTFDPVSNSLNGLGFTQLAFGVIAIMAFTSEYSSGSIRTTIAAVPQRRYVVIAKSIWVALLSGVVSIGISFGAFFAGQAVLSHYGLNVPLSHPGAVRAVIGGGLYMAGLSLFALGLGAIIRHTAGAITTLVAVMFILPGPLSALPDNWQHNLVRYLPQEAGASLANVVSVPTSLPPWRGFFLFLAWCLLVLGIGTYLLRTRDV